MLLGKTFVVSVLLAASATMAADAGSPRGKQRDDWGPINEGEGAPIVVDGGTVRADGGAALLPDGGIIKPRSNKPGLDVSKMSFSPEHVKQVVDFHLDEIQTCYEQTLAGKDKAIEGKLNTSFVIGTDGKVGDAKVLKKGSTVTDAKLNTCVVEVLKSMVFPKPPGKKQPVNFPFNLKAVH